MAIIAALQPGEERGDAHTSGLRIRCNAGGKKVFFYRYRDDAGSLRQFKLGELGPLTLAMARAKVAEMKVGRRHGADPQAEKKARRARASQDRALERQRAYTVGDAVQDFLEEVVERNRAAKGAQETRRMLARAIERFKDIPVHAFTKTDAHDLIKAMSGTAPRMAQMTRQELRSCWAHAETVGRATENPFLGRTLGAIPKIAPEQRHLLAEEVGPLLRWMHEPGTYSRTVRDALELTLRTGLRSGEVCGIHTRELVYRDGVLWLDIPGHRMKMREDHKVPLMGKAREIAVSRMPEGGGWLFPSSRADKPVDQKVLGVEVYACSGRSSAPAYRHRKVCPVRAWSPHDLRRTARTLLAELGCPYEVGEAILAHKLPGVAGDYNKADHLQARVDWLSRLGDHIDGLMAARAKLALVKLESSG